MNFLLSSYSKTPIKKHNFRLKPNNHITFIDSKHLLLNL
ncbi:hypothetical protein HPTD01_1887 [Halomonas sp. TD01]|nr:hypothetical protein HPTD01_1887 [Halomonas sp. TD01]